MGDDADIDDKEVLDDEPKSILLGIISQLKKGGDLSRITLPTFVLEPRSMTERITDFMSHPDLILCTPQKQDPVGRFIDVVRYFLSGWHIKPKGVKKPYNPVLGEFFRCKWKFPNGTEAVYICEQVSHHPPASAYFYASPDNDIYIEGDLMPKSKFLGNSAATMMQGTNIITFPRNHPGEEYFVTMPNVYARGILFGSMYMELGDTVTVKCPKNDLIAEIDFKTKGYFSGSYNSIAGKIKVASSGEVLYNISGKWTEAMYLQRGNGEKTVLFDVDKETISPKVVAPEAEQEEFESRRLWSKVTKGLTTRNLDFATMEKTAIEDNQRTIVKDRAAKGIPWELRYFTQQGEGWKVALDL
ncbi:hypothetical protein HK097_003508 [Rhizophlyctis rosea]|uniref:Oxysterol-binding protein n=1 Tax=Rhizophlyctis rosea TaxID=64517 RepID=A0AAD5SGK1_9FUNG|nr:hypothetical protein HK097_003508 [Rhizophlyctis rosea]